MTGTGAPRSPEQEQPADVVEGAPEDGGRPSRSPAMARAAKLNAANMARSLLPLVVICLLIAGWAALRQNPDDPVLDPGWAPSRPGSMRSDLLRPHGVGRRSGKREMRF